MVIKPLRTTLTHLLKSFLSVANLHAKLIQSVTLDEPDELFLPPTPLMMLNKRPAVRLA